MYRTVRPSPGPEKRNSCMKLYRGENAFGRSVPAMTAAEHPGRAGLRGPGIFSLGRCKLRRFRKRKNPPNPLRSGDRGTEKKFWSTPDSPPPFVPVPCSQLHLVARRHSGDRLFLGSFPAQSRLLLLFHELVPKRLYFVQFFLRRGGPLALLPQLGEPLRRKPIHLEVVVHILLVCQLLHLHSALRWFQYTDCFQSCQTLPSALREP